MLHAADTIVRVEGTGALFYGFKATLWRDLPFSALQFAFYEEHQKLAKAYMGSPDIGLPLEILTAASAGGMAGVITCPLDVVKTRIQTQHNPSGPAPKPSSSSDSRTAPPKSSKAKPSVKPSTRVASAATLDTSSVVTGLRIIYRTEGIAGWFRGVGPRFVWTSIQTGTMLVLYQMLLRWLEKHPLVSLGPDDSMSDL